MLTENDVVDIMQAWLEEQGYKIESCCHNTEKGDDIHAIDRNSKNLYVECKGEISKAGNKLNYWSNASGSFFNAFRDTVGFRPEAKHAIAIPDIENFHSLFDCLRPVFYSYGITVFWVKDTGEVTAWWPTSKAPKS